MEPGFCAPEKRPSTPKDTILTARIRVFHHSGPEIPGSAREGKPRSFFLCFGPREDGSFGHDSPNSGLRHGSRAWAPSQPGCPLGSGHYERGLRPDRFTKNKLFKRDAASIRRPFAGFSGLWRRHIMRFDRDRGGGHPPTPPTPPCLRVRTRRFETFRLTLLEQRRKTTIAEIGIRKRDIQSFRMGQMPWAMTTAGGHSKAARCPSSKSPTPVTNAIPVKSGPAMLAQGWSNTSFSI